MALEHEERAELLTAWPLLSPDLRQAILAIVHSADVMAEASCAEPECASTAAAGSRVRGLFAVCVQIRVVPIA